MKRYRGLLIFSLIWFTAVVVFSWKLSKDSGACDFRNRVVGARQAKLGINPYVFKWAPPYPETLLDPNDTPKNVFTRVTSPPTVLFLQSLVANADYELQRDVNFGLQWLLFFLMLYGCYRIADSDRSRALVLLGGIFMSVATFWLFHLERGQQYVYMAALGMVSILAAYRKKNDTGVGAGALGLLAAIRAPMLVTIMTGMLARKRRFILIFLAVYALVMGASTLRFGYSLWPSYKANVADWITGITGRAATRDVLPGFKYPATVEGHDWMQRYVTLPGVGKKLTGIYTGIWIPTNLSMVFTILATALVLAHLYLGRKKKSVFELSVQMWALALLIDYLLPTPRSSCNDALWFPLVFVLLSQWNHLRLKRHEKYLFAISVVGAPLVALFGSFDRTFFVQRQITKLILVPDFTFMLFCFCVAYSASLFAQKRNP